MNTENERIRQAVQEYAKAVTELTEAVTSANVRKLENTTAMIKQATKLVTELGGQLH